MDCQHCRGSEHRAETSHCVKEFRVWSGTHSLPSLHCMEGMHRCEGNMEEEHLAQAGGSSLGRLPGGGDI